MESTLCRVLRCAAVLAGVASAAFAVPADAGAQTITMVTDTSLVLDSNKPTTTGPQAAYVAFRVQGGSGQTGVTATLSGLPSASGIVLGGNQPAAQFISRLPADTTLYWYLQYPTTFGATANLTMTLSGGASASVTATVTTRKMNSAQSGGNTSGGLLGPGAVIGQILWFQATYEFGGSKAGDVYNLQPSGEAGFDARCFQLVGSDVISSSVTAIPTGAAGHNKQFFAASVAQSGTNFTATVEWRFKYRCTGVTSFARPYASMQSGSSNLAYSANFGAYIGPSFPQATNPFNGAVRKLVAPWIVPPGDTVTYGILIPNTGSPTWATSVDAVVDTLPAGLTYVAPVTVPGASVVTTVPTMVGLPGGATQLTWLGPIAVNAGDSIKIYFRVRVPSAQVPASLGRYVNTVSAQVGLERVGSARDTVQVAPADVKALKAGPASAVAGDTLRYVLKVWNSGPVRADSVAISDTLPAAVTFVKSTRAPAPTLAGRVLTWPRIPTMAVGDTMRDTVYVTVNGGTTGTITNIAAARAFTVDTLLGNNSGAAPDGRVSTNIGVAVEVNPQDGRLSLRLPGRDSSVFLVANHSTGTRSYDLFGRWSGAPAFITIDSIRGPALSGGARADSARATLPPNSSSAYTVWYTVAVGDTAVNSEYLRARSTVPDTLSRSEGWVRVRRVFPKLTLDKTVSPAKAPPGSDVSYTLAVDNIGEYAARTVEVTDSIPAQTLFKLGSATSSLPGGTYTVSYSNGPGSAWTPYTPTAGGCSAPSALYDACVRRIRWTLTTDLAGKGGSTSAQFGFVARIR